MGPDGSKKSKTLQYSASKLRPTIFVPLLTGENLMIFPVFLKTGPYWNKNFKRHSSPKSLLNCSKRRSMVLCQVLFWIILNFELLGILFQIRHYLIYDTKHLIIWSDPRVKHTEIWYSRIVAEDMWGTFYLISFRSI